MYKVLIADDLEILRYDLKRMKAWDEIEGFIIAGEAENGLDALKKLRATPYDLLITDIKMPVMDGMELLKAVFQEKLCPCVVLLSDYTEFTYAREGLLHGAFDYLGKPVENKDISELLSRVKLFLDQKKENEDRIKQWEGLAEEAFFPSYNVDQVASLLVKAQDEALTAMKSLLETVGAAMNYDSNKVIIILENVTEQIFSKVNEKNEWIRFYTDVEYIKWPSFSKCQVWDDIYKTALNGCSRILVFLKKFILWKEVDTFIKSACLEVLYNIENNISVQTVAEKLFISKAYLSEKFKQTAGSSLAEYISNVKMERAKYLLMNGSLKNYEIADVLGFKDHEYFSIVFKKYTGFSPAMFKKENKKL